MNELSWIKIARNYIGTKEIKGSKHNPVIVGFWGRAFKTLKKVVGIKDDDTAWCGAFMANVFSEAGLVQHIPNAFAWARSYLTVGTKLDKPAYGCVVVFSRGTGGHVGFVVGKDTTGRLMVLGGNQSDSVNIMAFDTSRVLGYRWCGAWSIPNKSRYNLPLYTGTTILSTNEV